MLMQTGLFVIVKYVLKFKEYLLESFKDAWSIYPFNHYSAGIDFRRQNLTSV